MWVLIFSTKFSEQFLILSSIEAYIVENVYWFSCEVLVILVRF